MEEDFGKGGFPHDMANIIGVVDGDVEGNRKNNSKGQRADTGASNEAQNVDNGLGSSVEKVKRLYPAGRRNASQVGPLATSNAHLNNPGVPICWDFVSYGGCTRGAKCANAHGNMTLKNMHWAAKCDLTRRGGLR